MDCHVRGCGFLVPETVEVQAIDSGDDSSMTIEIICEVPENLIEKQSPSEENTVSDSEAP